MKFAAVSALALAGQALAHYNFPSLIVNGVTLPLWANVRRTNNFNHRGPVEDVKSQDIRCYTSETNAAAATVNVAAGSTIGFSVDTPIYHQGVLNVYMAKVPAGRTAANWDGSGTVWFKIHEISAKTNGGSSISWPTDNMGTVNFPIPRTVPSGEYLIRIEHIALHSAGSFGGAQFYIACGQINVTGGGSGQPGPLVAFPGAYTGNEPGILINIYWPIPTTYVQPGPAVWRG